MWRQKFVMIHVLLTSSYHGNIITPLRFSLAFVFLGSRSFFQKSLVPPLVASVVGKFEQIIWESFWKLKTTLSRYSWSEREIVSEEVTRELAYLVTASKGRFAMIAKFLDLNSVPASMAKKKNEKIYIHHSITQKAPLSRKIVENQKFATMVTWRHISSLYCASINKAEKYFGHF